MLPKQKNDETNMEYYYRLGFMKMNGELDLTWKELADTLNLENAGAYERKCQRMKMKINNGAEGCLFKLKTDKADASPVQNFENGVLTSVEYTITDTQDIKSELKCEWDDSLLTEEAIIKKHGFDPLKFKLVKSQNSKWDTQLKGGTIKTLFASKIIVRPKKFNDLNKETIYDTFLECLADTQKPKEYEYQKHNLLKSVKFLEINIADLHIGKLASALTAPEPYNHTIAISRMNNVIDQIIEKYESYQLDEILLVVSNDYLHVDSPKNTTVKGTLQDMSCTYHDMVVFAFEALLTAIEKLKQLAPVKTMYFYSNHDGNTMWHMMRTVEAYYKNDKNVEVDSKPMPRKCYTNGLVMLGYTHEKPAGSKLSEKFAAEFPDAHGETKFREIHIGHEHHEEAFEEQGYTIRKLPSLSSADAWHTISGYEAQKRAQVFLWDTETGLDEITYFKA